MRIQTFFSSSFSYFSAGPSHTNRMCTSICLKNLYGRTLDHHQGYGEQPVILPPAAPFYLKDLPHLEQHYGLVGMATVAGGVPLYYDGINEKGLFMAGLLFAGNAVYLPPKKDCYNVAPYELIPWILGQCPDLKAARALLQRVNLTDRPFSQELPLSPLHWMVADSTGALVVEPGPTGLQLYENPFGVLTNNPPFPYHKTHLTDYLNLTPHYPASRFGNGLCLTPYSRGMGAMGLPGDWSSASRFVRAAFVAANGPREPSLCEYFQMLDGVWVPRGVALDPSGEPIITRYACCCDPRAGAYHYTTCRDRSIRTVTLDRADQNATTPVVMDL